MMKISFASITGFVGTGAFFGSTFSVAVLAGLASAETAGAAEGVAWVGLTGSALAGAVSAAAA